MHARDSSGNQVSLLNDDSAPQANRLPLYTPNYASYPIRTSFENSNMSRSYSTDSSQSAYPTTPGLQRSDSYDSNTTNDPNSPITPIGLGEIERQPSYLSAGHSKEPAYEEHRFYDGYHLNAGPQHLQMSPSRAPYDHSMPDQQTYSSDYVNGALDRGMKRYPCRYKDSHHCDKTFTTSGHASRHSKIHTAEKAVHCTHSGCSKKFTRSDNMKQHLETHNKHSKDRSKGRASTPSASTLTKAAGIHKAGLSRPSSTSGRRPEDPLYDVYYAPAPFSPRDLARPIPVQTELPSRGLDALAAVAVMQSHP